MTGDKGCVKTFAQHFLFYVDSFHSPHLQNKNISRRHASRRRSDGLLCMYSGTNRVARQSMRALLHLRHGDTIKSITTLPCTTSIGHPLLGISSDSSQLNVLELGDTAPAEVGAPA
eukprot:SAG31_NODE_10315_length_1154_cov_7.469194_2_plen_116_part_00